MTAFTATYSPDDNKLRLYASTRLDAETYARVKAAGFKWAPRQELFVAPTWTPEREDLLLELAGEIDDEDRELLAQRIEDRADRFEGYSERREAEAKRAADAVAAIADNIPLGQPILVGHHSERRARKDAERIRDGMRKAVKLWDTSNYWTSRAAGALAAAKYKERPDVRARRIKAIEADLRKVQRSIAEVARRRELWQAVASHEAALALAGSGIDGHAAVAKREGFIFGWTAYDVLLPADRRSAECPVMTWEDVRAIRIASCDRYLLEDGRAARWVAHYENRLAYERAMLGETGYVEPPKRASKAVLPLLNYDGPVRVRNPYHRGEFDDYATAHPMTSTEYAKIHKDYKGTRIDEHGTHRVRVAMLSGQLVRVFLTDAKVHARPGTGEAAAEVDARVQAAQDTLQRNAKARAAAKARNAEVIAAHRGERRAVRQQDQSAVETFKALRAAVKAGVQVVSAPQLFPTPAALAAEVVARAEIGPGDRVLEPSAGTGALLRAIVDAAHGRAGPAPSVTAVEINRQLADALPAHLAERVICADFLTCDPGRLGLFDRIVMNPPFQNAADIDHVVHALGFLAPGGRLVSICANGPRQTATLRPLAESHGGQWVELPPGAFAESGTQVRAALLVLNKPALRAAA